MEIAKNDIFDLMINNARYESWVEKEINELWDAGKKTLREVCDYYSDVFIANKVDRERATQFFTNFINTYNVIKESE